MINFNLTAYYNYIKSTFDCWCCCNGPMPENRQNNDHNEQNEQYDIKIEIHSKRHGSSMHQGNDLEHPSTIVRPKTRRMELT